MKNLELKGKNVFLLKMPKYLSEQIKKNKENQDIGEIELDEENGTCQIKLNKNFSPLEYTVTMKKDLNKYAVDVNGEEDTQVVMPITEHLLMKPVMNKEYFEFKRAMTEVNEKNKHNTIVLNHFEEIKKGEKYSGLKEMEAYARKKKEMLQDKKRERLDKQDAIDILFKAFEKHENWTVKDLADFSGQPLAYIQEIIGEIAVLNKNDHRNTYRLKDQFR